jgi:hypothetical protein
MLLRDPPPPGVAEVGLVGGELEQVDGLRDTSRHR